MKYIYLYNCNKSLGLFNYHRALPYIREKNEVIVVEGAKSVMLLDQWGLKNCVSLEGNSLSPVQAKLLKDLGVEIVFAFDKDITIEFIKKQVQQIKNRIVYALFDKDNLFKDKQSLVDNGVDICYNLYTNYKYRVI